jgi:hypothetical protein
VGRPETGLGLSGAKVVFIGTHPRSASPAVWLTSGRGLCQTLMFSAGTSARRARSGAPPVEAERPSAPNLLSRLRVFPEMRDGRVTKRSA